jgi:hypothetical protein
MFGELDLAWARLKWGRKSHNETDLISPANRFCLAAAAGIFS